MNDHRTPSATAILITSAIATGGMLAHNLIEFEPAFLLTAETLIPLAIFVVLAALARSGIAAGVVMPALLGWAVLNLVGGGILSGLPLPILPFTPDESIGHYAAHAIYTVAEIPLIVVAARALRVGRSPADVPNGR